METRHGSHGTQGVGRRSYGALWFVGVVLILSICIGMAAQGGGRPAQAQGISPTNTPPTPYQCMTIAYSFTTETSVVVGVNNNTGATTRLQTAMLDWPSGLGGAGGDYVDYFTFGGNQFYAGNATAPPTSADAPDNTTYQITNGQTREFVAAFGPLPLPRPLGGTFTVTLLFRNGCSVSVSVTHLMEPTRTPQPTITPPTPYQCMYIQYAYVTEMTVVVGVNNNSGTTTQLQTATLNWPAGLGGTGGDYVDYFQFGGNQFYGGNDAVPPTPANAPNNATYQIIPGQTRDFVAAFGSNPFPLPRPLYGTLTVTLLFRNGCTVSISVVREPPPSSCPTITNAYFSGANLTFVVYNNLGVDTSLIGAELVWPDIPSPNRYVNYFRWGTDQFYPGNDYDPPTSANDSSPDLFTAGDTGYFTANFGNPGTLSGAFTVTLNFSYPCSVTYTLWWGLTPTLTPTPTVTLTPTPTATEIPLTGGASVRYSALLLNAPDFGLEAQTVSGRIGGGVAPYTVTVTVEDPDGNQTTYTPTVQPDGTFELNAATTGDTYFGCSVQGIWRASFDVQDSVGHVSTSTPITWAVSFPRVHAIP